MISHISLAKNGLIIADPSTGEVEGNYAVFQMLEDTKFSTFEGHKIDTDGLTVTDITFSAGTIFYSDCSSFTVDTGLVVATKHN